jgi:hypothetical protein
LQFRYRGSRRRSAVAQLFSLGRRERVMKSFKRIHMIFAVFFIVGFVCVMSLSIWLGHLHDLDDSSHTQFYLWQPRVEAIGLIFNYSATIPWLLFAIYHLFVVIGKKIQSHEKH